MILDSIFDNKIGIGPAQYYPLFFLSLIDLNDGAQLILSKFKTMLLRLIPDANCAGRVAAFPEPGLHPCLNLLPGGVLRLHYNWQAV